MQDLHSLSRHHAICSARLHPANDVAMPVHLNAAEDIFGPRDSSKVRGVSAIAQMHPAALAGTTGTALSTRASGSRAASAAPRPLLA